jgi:hypothetical protein
MRRIKLIRLCVSLAFVTSLTVAAAFEHGAFAQSLGLKLGEYKLLPRLSVLQRTGGIAGVNQRLRLFGSYEIEQSPLAIYPPMVSFQNAEIWGSLISDLPNPAYVEDVDEILNLEGLFGRQVPVEAPFDLYKFAGKTRDGSSIQLHAAAIGPWMYVRGSTTPPPNSADYFVYELRMVARSRPFADLNEDGRVDAADYTVLRDRAGAAGAGSIGASTDEVTYSDWREQFGEQVPDFTAVDDYLTGAGSGFPATLTATATPEPTTAALVCLCCAMLGARRIRVR